ncbi:MAG: 16S rRNA (cytosine(1402)-N(4))-methyltransferase RsmH [Tannerellaceae bacterium]|jgi:16S rRNA (cytosine1402-N4)-methyltransferase|nr:16S rRNA (cytosine(1402)-N(4))-methyltransferase RsmH [Tannerellaceae bacterium]
MESCRQAYHIPALLSESLEGMQIKPSGTYVDATFGGGGHSRAILDRLGEGGRLFGMDQDADAEANIPDDRRFVFIRSNFRYLYHFMRYHNVLGAVDGLLADLGVSSHHFDEASRGFSFRLSGQLDMRMNARAGLTAADVINTYSEAALADVFFHYGELSMSRPLAATIVRRRSVRNIDTIDALLEAASGFIPKDRENKVTARLFQALRMEVNDEVNALKEMLQHALMVLKPGGRLVVLSYHSVEDRLVKNFLRSGNFEGKRDADFYGNVSTPFRLINNKVITPSAEEIAANPRSRSAKLRVAELI